MTSTSTVSFDQLELHPSILRAVAAAGYLQATPVQAQAIPMILAGKDLLASAQTGTGKTAAFTLPALNLLATPHPLKSRGPRILVLTPTRELAAQVNEAARKYGKFIKARTVSIVGGMPYPLQNKLLSQPLDILVATPGRLLDHMERGRIDMSRLQMLILDEADRMLDMGFLPDLQRIISLIPAQRQTLLFSATFSPEIKKLAQSYLRDPVTIEVARQNAAADTVRQVIHMVPSERKKDAVVKVLNTRIQQGLSRQAIVFTNSRIGCSKLASALERSGIKAGAIHGDKSQIERMQILESFKNGSMDVLVATDVAARGLDIADMPCVINHELPFNAEDYVHRIGRTGRAGAQGDAIALVDASEEKLLADIEKLMNRKLIRMPVPDPAGGPGADPFFYMPYQAKDNKGAKETVTNSESTKSGNPSIKPGPKSSKPVAALLGGFKKSN